MGRGSLTLTPTPTLTPTLTLTFHPNPHPHPNQVWRLLAALLELGNLQFEEGGDDDAFGGCCPTDDAQLRRCAEQLGCEAGHLRD